jgi:hypothetical protein
VAATAVCGLASTLSITIDSPSASTPGSSAIQKVTCKTGYALSGGCAAGSGSSIQASYPIGALLHPDGWSCTFTTASVDNVAYVLCYHPKQP